MTKPLISAASMRRIIALNARSFVDSCVLSGDRDGTPFSMTLACRFDGGKGTTDDRGPVRVARGSLVMAFPLDTDIAEEDCVLFGGELLSVVWAPPVGALDVERAIGLKRAH